MAVIMLLLMLMVTPSFFASDDLGFFPEGKCSGDQKLEFWGLLAAPTSSGVIKVTVGTSRYKYTELSFTHTHVTARRVGLTENKSWTRPVTGQVSPGWRRFLLQVSRRQDTCGITLTDDHGATWLGDDWSFADVDSMKVVVPHFNTTCHTLTPVWRVEGRAPTDVLLPPLLDRLQFTLVGAGPPLPLLTLGQTDLNLEAAVEGGGHDMPLPSGPLVLCLTLDHLRPAAPPRLARAAVGVQGVVGVTVGGPVATIRFTSTGGGAYHVVQQLHVSAATQDNPRVTVTDRPLLEDRPLLAGWPVLAGAAAALLLAGVGGGAAVSRLVRTRTTAPGTTTPTSEVLVAPRRAGTRVDEAPRKSDSPYLEPRPSLFPASVLWSFTSPPSLTSPSSSPEHMYEEVDESAAGEALPHGPRAAIVVTPCRAEQWRNEAPLQSDSHYLVPRHVPFPLPVLVPLHGPGTSPTSPPIPSPEPIYEGVEECEAADSFTSDDNDYDGHHFN